jgi:hypothetical protein
MNKLNALLEFYEYLEGFREISPTQKMKELGFRTQTMGILKDMLVIFKHDGMILWNDLIPIDENLVNQLNENMSNIDARPQRKINKYVSNY